MPLKKKSAYFDTPARRSRLQPLQGKVALSRKEAMKQTRIANELRRQAGFLAEDVHFLYDCFDCLDCDGDGKISEHELLVWLLRLHDRDRDEAGQLPRLQDAQAIVQLNLLDMQRHGRESSGASSAASAGDDADPGLDFRGFLLMMQDYYMGLGAENLRAIYKDLLLNPDEGLPPEGVAFDRRFVVVRANGLSKSDLGGKSDPYVVVTHNGTEVGRTRTIYRTLDPVWEMPYEIGWLRAADSQQGGSLLRLSIFDHDLLSADDPLGYAELRVTETLLGEHTLVINDGEGSITVRVEDTSEAAVLKAELAAVKGAQLAEEERAAQQGKSGVCVIC